RVLSGGGLRHTYKNTTAPAPRLANESGHRGGGTGGGTDRGTVRVRWTEGHADASLLRTRYRRRNGQNRRRDEQRNGQSALDRGTRRCVPAEDTLPASIALVW